LIEPRITLQVELAELKGFRMYDKDMVAASIYLNEDANVKSWYFKIEAEEVNDFCARNEQLANAMQC